jgi:hypothetical protein
MRVSDRDRRDLLDGKVALVTGGAGQSQSSFTTGSTLVVDGGMSA